MNNSLLSKVIDRISILFIEYRHIKAFYQHFPHKGTDYNGYVSKMSLLYGLTNQHAIETKQNATQVR